jgi:hypothetical protein
LIEHHRQAGFAQQALQRRGGGLLRIALSLIALRWRTSSSTPATSTGDSDVVKMKPGA